MFSIVNKTKLIVKLLKNNYEGNWFDKGIIFFTFVVTNSIYVANKARQKNAINFANNEIFIYLKKNLYLWNQNFNFYQ